MQLTDVDLELAPVPRTVHLDGEKLDVLSAVYLPGKPGHHASHVVIHAGGSEAGYYAVHYLIHNEDEQRSYLLQGSYSLTWYEAVEELMRRVSRT